MRKRRPIIVSPSGNLYGSEKVLLDFLATAEEDYEIYLPEGRLRRRIAGQLPQVRLRVFSRVQLLYPELFLRMIFSSRRFLYCNEGGHIRRIGLLARLLPHKRFFVHLRIAEDCGPARLRNLPDNVTLIVVSDYLMGLLPEMVRAKSVRLHDPYLASGRKGDSGRFRMSPLPKIGVVGRVTRTKGLQELAGLTDYAEAHGTELEIHLFGSFDPTEEAGCAFRRKMECYRFVRIVFEGFVEHMEAAYDSMDVIWHFSLTEPLGRIFFEALDSGTFFTGFDSGGIGEIGHELGLSGFLVEYGEGWEKRFLASLKRLHGQDAHKAFCRAAKKMQEAFSPSGYARALETLFKK